jgi:hypothetical protein
MLKNVLNKAMALISLMPINIICIVHCTFYFLLYSFFILKHEYYVHVIEDQLNIRIFFLECCLLRCDVLQFGRSLQIFQRNGE